MSRWPPPPEPGPGRYGEGVLGGTSDTEHRRLAAMAQVSDPPTRALLGRLAVGPGWRCWEVGAGGGTVATWLAGQVAGPKAGGRTAGQVLATDVDVSVLSTVSVPRLSVQRHDVARDPMPDGLFDLIHARFVLEHLAEREDVLDRLVHALAPGGVIAVECIAEFPIDSSTCKPFRASMRAVERVLAATIGTDSRWARSFPQPFLDRGLVEVGTEVSLPTTGGCNASASCWNLTLQRLRPLILERGLASEAHLDAASRLLADPAFFDYAFATVAGWGRSPQQGPAAGGGPAR